MIAGRAWWGPVAIASALSAGALDAANVHSAVRVAVAVWFVLVCPGVALVRLLRVEDAAAELALGIAVSIALAVAVGATTLYAGRWSPGVTLAVLVAITVAAAGAPLAHARPRRRP